MINWLQGHNQHTNFKAMVNHDGVFGRSSPSGNCVSASLHHSICRRQDHVLLDRAGLFLREVSWMGPLPFSVGVLILVAELQRRWRYDALGRPSTI